MFESRFRLFCSGRPSFPACCNLKTQPACRTGTDRCNRCNRIHCCSLFRVGRVSRFSRCGGLPRPLWHFHHISARCGTTRPGGLALQGLAAAGRGSTPPGVMLLCHMTFHRSGLLRIIFTHKQFHQTRCPAVVTAPAGAVFRSLRRIPAFSLLYVLPSRTEFTRDRERHKKHRGTSNGHADYEAVS